MNKPFRKFDTEPTHGKRIVSDVRPRTQSVRPLAPHQKPALEAPRHSEGGILPRPHRQKRNWFPGAPKAGHIVFVLVLAGITIASLFWSSSLALTITPQTTSFQLERDMKITIDAEEVANNVVKRMEGKSAQSQKYNQRASGTIVVFNNFNAEPQTLVERTRFQTPTGLIFRSTARVTVPAKVGDKPGSVEVGVLADVAGEKYNVGLSDFTIPGFVGTPKFQKFFARSKTEIKGGAAGEGRIVGKNEAEELLAKLELEVNSELEGGLKDRVPAGFIAFPDKIDRPPLTHITDPAIGSPSDTFFAEVRGTVRTLAVDKNKFSNAIARALFRDDAKASIYELASSPEVIVKSAELDYVGRKINLVLYGTVKFRGIVDIEEIKKAVMAAQDEEALDAIFVGHSGSIAKVEKTFRPAFFKRIPGRSSRISISVVGGDIDTKR